MTRDGPGQYAPPEAIEADRVALANLLLRLRRMGISDQRTAAAIEAVPRRLFVPPHSQAVAYEESALPIDCGQTISAPSLVGRMTAALGARPDDRVLEIGTGSGYQTAILAALCRHVYTIDRYRGLVEAAEARFRTLGIANISASFGDGMIGLPAEAPFDRILVSAAAETVPPALRDQLALGGTMVIPVGHPQAVQRLLKIDRERPSGDLVETEIAKVRFVPLLPGRAERL